VNAGHNPPVLLRADGSHSSLEAGGLMFGVLPGAPYAAGHTTFGPGDLLVLYTDGVTEGASTTLEQWGDDRLLAAVRRGAARPCSELVRGVAEEVRTFEGEQGPADDITLLVARRV
jgi:sigma-B regulation protein RsbU (phosphoserine phosphatase)